jgi:glycosyltransferase involved in cell wall biosynthesis
MKRIAWILDTFPSPSETFIARDITALRSRGFVIEVFALNAGEGARAIRKLGRMRANWKQTGGALGELMRQEGYAHVHGGWASHPADIARTAANTAHITWSFSAHARDLWVDGADWHQKLESAQFAHCCTRAGAEFLQSFTETTPIIYASHGLDLKEWPFASEKDANEPLLLGVGRLVEKKGWDIWLRALAVLSETEPHLMWRAEIIGDGSQRASLQKLARELRLDGHLKWRGALPVEDVRAAMQHAQAVVFSGRTAHDGDRDGLPNVLLEAAALGTPIVATRAGCVEEFSDDAALWLCEAENGRSLAQAMGRALREKTEAQKRARCARLIVEDRFSLDHAVAPLATAFETVLLEKA